MTDSPLYQNLFATSSSSLWTPGHSKAFSQSSDYNQFFLFFHKPKEKLRLIPFTTEENLLFLNTLALFFQSRSINSKDLQGNWGLFSLNMPFRNGLACYSQYLAIKAQGIVDRNNAFLNNIKDIDGFIAFFKDLEPVYRATTNHNDLLRKMEIDIEPLIREIIEIKLEMPENLVKTTEKSIICDSKPRFFSFLRENVTENRYLEVIKPNNFDDFMRKTGKTIRKRLKKEENDSENSHDFTFSPRIKPKISNNNNINDFTLSKSKIPQIKADLNEETFEIQKTASFPNKKSQKRDYSEMIRNSIGKKEKKPLFFGFNERGDDGYDSEPNLDHIFEKIQREIERKNVKKSNVFSDNEEKVGNLKRKYKEKKEKKLFEYQEKGRLKVFLEDEGMVPVKRLKKEEKKRRKKQVFIEEEDQLLLEENMGKIEIEAEEETNRNTPKKRKIIKKIVDFIENFKNLRVKIAQEMNFLPIEDLYQHENPNNNPIDATNNLHRIQSLIKQIKSLKKLFHQPKSHRPLQISSIQTLLHSKPLQISSIPNPLALSLLESFKDLLLCQQMSLLITSPSHDHLKQVWPVVFELSLGFKQSELFPSIKPLLSLFTQFNFESLILSLWLGDNSTVRVSEMIALVHILMKIQMLLVDSNQKKTIYEILMEFLLGFIRCLRQAVSKMSVNNPKLLKKRLKKPIFPPNFAVFYENSSLKQEDRFPQYVIFLLQIETFDIDSLENQAGELVQALILDFLLVFERFNLKINDFMINFIEKLVFNQYFPILTEKTLANSLEISKLFLEIYSLDIGFFLKIKEKILQIMPFLPLLETFENLENNIKALFSLALFKERRQASEQHLPIIEKRVFSRIICSLRQFEKFHGDFQKLSDYRVFKIEFSLINALLESFPAPFFQLNTFKFLNKFIKNRENSHGSIKLQLISVNRKVFENLLMNYRENTKEILDLAENDGLFNVCDELFQRIIEVFNEMTEISRFLSNFSMNSGNQTENERIMEAYNEDLGVQIQGFFEFLRDSIRKTPEIFVILLETIVKNDNTCKFFAFKPENPIFCLVREKFTEFCIEILEKVEISEEIYEKHCGNTEDYEEIIKQVQLKEAFALKIRTKAEKLASKGVFGYLMELITSILNKPLQAKIPLKFQVSTSLLRLACELLGRISKLLIFTGQTAIFERLTSTFLDLNATLFLDSSIKLVYKCDKYPYHLLLKAEKLSLVLLIIRHLARGFDRNNGFPLGLIRNKGFEEFTEKLFGLFSIALFHLDREQEDLIKVYCFLREFMGFLCKNNGVTKDNNNNSSYFMPISEIKTMFSDAFPNKPLQKPIKILKILLETHGKLPKSRIFHDFCLFILRNLKSESFPPSSCPYILSNSLYFMRHLLITSSNAPDPTKLLRTHTEFQDLLFKRPRVLSAPLPMELLLQRDPLKIDAIIPQFSKYLIQLCLLSEKGVAVRQEDDTISLVLSQILSHEIAAFQTMKIPLYRIFETMAFPNKLGVILQLVSHIMGRTTGSQKIMEKILGMIIQGFFRNNERDLGFLAIIFSNRILGGTGVEEGVKVAIRVLGKNIEKIMDFRFFARVFEGFEVNLAGVKALEAYLRIAEDFYLKTVRIFEKFGFFEDLNVFSSNFIRLMRDLLMAIMGSIDRELLRLWMDRGRRVFLMNFIQTIDKQKLFGLCRRAFEIIDGFERISGGNLNCLNEILSNLEENREENDVFIQNIVKILREKLFLN